MKLFTEYPEKEEQKYYEILAAKAKVKMDKLYGNQEQAKRDTHAKTHAAVKGTLEIFNFDEDKIKRELAQRTQLTEAELKGISLKQGLLAEAKSYPVWLRFANGRTSVEPDYVNDGRSMSVKVMGVVGERLPQSHELHTQDIIVQNCPRFPVKTIKYYYSFFNATLESEQAVLWWLLTHPQQFLALRETISRSPKSLLTERYWSMSAYALGLKPDFDPSQPGRVPVDYPVVIKYAFTPVYCQSPHQTIPYQSRPGMPKLPFISPAKSLGLDENQPDNYYRNELIQNLAQPDAHYCWDFGIQFQINPKMSIDDVTITWGEEESPFWTVGRLSVQHQLINFEKQKDFGENLRFSSWNGLAVHRPVGAINRLRARVYPIVAEYRHQKQGLHYQEPTGAEEFK
ncbi:MAG: catalase [Coleofasciculus sp. G3-WIS-01]|uniref:catalase n=1 Tax=Coleofasciculus sp. G3-WIS-01 TaxID=3069528 RepID=UPI0032FD60CB